MIQSFRVEVEMMGLNTVPYGKNVFIEVSYIKANIIGTLLIAFILLETGLVLWPIVSVPS